MPIVVTEFVTELNFDAEAYTLANSDIASLVERGGDAAKHYRLHGCKEKRRQLRRPFMDARADFLAAKFARFKATFDIGTEWAFAEEPDRFPIVIGCGHFSKRDYAVESLSSQYPPFRDMITANPDGLYMDLGSGFGDVLFENVLYVEVYPSLTADVIVAADCAYPFHSDTFDGIGCFAVLEHVKYPWKAASEIKRMLKPGGKAFVDWPFLQPVHGFPSHYYNATRQGLELLFSTGGRVDACRTEPTQDAAFTIDWILRKFVQDLPDEKRRRFSALTILDLMQQSPLGPFWRDMMDGLPDETFAELACGNTLWFTKVDASPDTAEARTGGLPRARLAPAAAPSPSSRVEPRGPGSLWDHVRHLASRRLRTRAPR